MLLNEFQETGYISLLNFFSRRFKRLLPNACLTMWFVICLGKFVVPHNIYLTWLTAVQWSCIFSANLFFYRKDLDYFQVGGDTYPQPLLHFWSLACEEQFYIIWPIIFIMFTRNFSPSTIRVLILLCIASSFSLWLFFNDTMFNYYLLPARLWELFVGILVSFNLHPLYSVVNKEGTKNYTQNSPLTCFAGCLNYFGGLLGLLIIIGVSIFYTEETLYAYPGWSLLLPVFGTILLLVFSRKSISSMILSNTILVKLGDASYSIYLWHWGFISFGSVISQRYAHISLSLAKYIAALLSIPFALFVYQFLEMPLRRMKLSGWMGICFGAILMTFTFMAATILLHTMKEAPIFEQEIQSMLLNQPKYVRTVEHVDTKQDPNELLSIMLEHYSLENISLPRVVRHNFSYQYLQTYPEIIWRNPCTRESLKVQTLYNRDTGTLFGPYLDNDSMFSSDSHPYIDYTKYDEVILYGDSHALTMWTGFQVIAKQSKVHLFLLWGCYCGTYAYVKGFDCAPQLQTLIDWLQTKSRNRTLIVLVSRMIPNGAPNVKKLRTCTYGAMHIHEELKWFNKYAPSMITSGATVVYMEDNPCWPSLSINDALGPGSCLLKNKNNVVACALDAITERNNRFAYVEQERNITRRLGFKFLNTHSLFCSSTKCPLLVGDVVVMEEQNHMSRDYSYFIAHPLGWRLRSLLLDTHI